MALHELILKYLPLYKPEHPNIIQNILSPRHCHANLCTWTLKRISTHNLKNGGLPGILVILGICMYLDYFKWGFPKSPPKWSHY
ncbi:hypothetical protein GDO78_018680 [Eleutherodactylus coqui]|uniref:Uncharacterized protein n=1 Tax=Eleutherodactylus coqui TaxID=57060 RepID=A0A8J6EJ59_ELECQ|nr:hypothetical protein GDO78_018680 [Eleutherodactylus coqui]